MKGHGLHDQYAGYRRGLVLGLTMAEVGILIIFVLLLLIAYNQWLRDQESKEREGTEAIPVATLNDLQAAAVLRDEIRAVLQLPPAASVEEISQLVRVVQQQLNAKPEARTAIQETRDALERIRHMLDAARRDGLSDALARALEKQSFQLANQEGQLKRYEAQLKEAGLGKGERPCWVNPDGTIDFLYDVVLASNGIRMREYEYPERARERATLPLPVVDPAEVLSEAEFLRRTEPLYNSSLSLNCRFFVVIYDATGPAEKELYKRELRTVEGHFYKLLRRDPAPF